MKRQIKPGVAIPHQVIRFQRSCIAATLVFNKTPESRGFMVVGIKLKKAGLSPATYLYMHIQTSV